MDANLDKQTYSFRCSNDILQDKVIIDVLDKQKNKTTFIKNCIESFINAEKLYSSVDNITIKLEELLKNQELIVDTLSKNNMKSEKEITSPVIAPVSDKVINTNTNTNPKPVDVPTLQEEQSILEQPKQEEKNPSVDKQLATNMANCMANFIRM